MYRSSLFSLGIWLFIFMLLLKNCVSCFWNGTIEYYFDYSSSLERSIVVNSYILLKNNTYYWSKWNWIELKKSNQKETQHVIWHFLAICLTNGKFLVIRVASHPHWLCIVFLWMVGHLFLDYTVLNIRYDGFYWFIILFISHRLNIGKNNQHTKRQNKYFSK